MRKPHSKNISGTCSRCTCRRAGFTLVEMLVVMGIIVLALALAVPAIRILTGNKSEQAAQNTVSAYLASARADAIGIQDVEGVLFYLDPGTGRVNCVEVAQSPQPLNVSQRDVPGVVYLDLEGGVHPGKSRDPMPLPVGIGLETIKDTVSYGETLVDPLSAAQYMGFNLYPPATTGQTNVAALGGVILFDGNGRIFTGRYGFRFTTPATTNGISPLGELVFGHGALPNSNWPSTSSATESLQGQIAFAFFDMPAFLNQHDTSSDPFLLNNQGNNSLVINQNPADGTNSGQQTWWLNQNTTAIFVNRYNGTLIRAE